MTQIALFSDDTTLRDMLNQIDGFQVAYFSTELDTNQLPKNISLAIFDFDIVPLSLLDEWEQFPRLHLRKMAVVSVDNMDKVDEVLERLDNYVVRPLSVKALNFRTQEIRERRSVEYASFIRSEIGNPLTSIRGYSNLLMSDDYGVSDEHLKSFVNVIQNNVENLNNLTHQYVDWVRIENKYGYHFEWYEIAKILSTSVESIKKQFDEKHQKLIVSIDEAIPALFGDQYRILHVFHMLLDNASTFSPENTKTTLTIFIKDNHVNCQILDNGVGIRQEFYVHVFEKFWSDHHRPKNATYGLGLSLYLCKQIIEMHGGKIWFESKVGVGTKFIFTLPIAK